MLPVQKSLQAAEAVAFLAGFVLPPVLPNNRARAAAQLEQEFAGIARVKSSFFKEAVGSLAQVLVLDMPLDKTTLHAGLAGGNFADLPGIPQRTDATRNGPIANIGVQNSPKLLMMPGCQSKTIISPLR